MKVQKRLETKKKLSFYSFVYVLFLHFYPDIPKFRLNGTASLYAALHYIGVQLKVNNCMQKTVGAIR